MGFLSFLDKAEHKTLSFLGNTGRGLGHLGADIIRTDIVNPTRELAAQVTRNPTAYKNAEAAQDKSLKTVAPAVHAFTRPIPEAITTLTHPFSKATYTPGSPLEKGLFGDTPVQNIQAKVVGNYNDHPNLNPAARLLLAGGEGLFSVAQDAPVVGATAKIAGSTGKTIKTANEMGAIGNNVKLIGDLAKADTPGKVESILKTNGVDPLTANKLSGSIAMTSDPHIIENILQGESKIPSLKQAVIPPPPEPAKAAESTLPSQEIADRAYQETVKNGGVTIDAKGVTPNDGIAFSPYKNIETVVDHQNFTPEAVDQFVKKHADILKDPSHHIGIWEDNGKYYLDISRVGPKDASTLQQGMDAQQLAAFDLGAFKEIPLGKITKNEYTPLHEASSHPYLSEGQNPAADTPGAIGQSQEIPKGRSGPDLSSPTPAKAAASEKVASSPAPAEATPKSTSTPVRPPATPAGQGSPAENIMAALKGLPASKGQSPVAGLETLQAQQKAATTAARSQKLAQATTAAEGKVGREATYSQLKSLKGEIPKVDATNLHEHLQKTVDPADVEASLTQLQQSDKLSRYDSINAQSAFVKLFDQGILPRPSEWKKIETVLGPDLRQTIEDTAGLYEKSKNLLSRVLGAPKSILSSFDLSGMGRQGAVLGSRFPQEFKKSFVSQAKFLVNAEHYEQTMKAIGKSENAPLYEKMKLALTGVKDFKNPEEAFASTLPEDIPLLGKGVEASNRAYTGALTQLRADVADHIIRNLKEADIDLGTMSDKAWADLGRFINTASGRGSLGSLEHAAKGLGQALFSPRLWKSRLDMLNPLYYKSLDPVARKYALQSSRNFAAIAGAVLGLAAVAGAEVETDARSSDFLKIKIGNTRYDILGGFQQNLVLAHREIFGEKKSSTNGSVTKLGGGFGKADRLSILSDFVQNKENPIISSAGRIIKGTDRSGQPTNLKNEAIGLVTPLAAQDAARQIQDSGVAGIPKSIPGFLGAGSQTYGVRDIGLSATQKAIIKNLQTDGAPKDQIDATKLFYQTLKTVPSRDNANTAINDAIAKGDNAKAIQAAKDYNAQLSAAFKDWVQQYGKYASEPELVKAYNSARIKLTGSSIKQRLNNIQSSPLYKATLGGQQ